MSQSNYIIKDSQIVEKFQIPDHNTSKLMVCSHYYDWLEIKQFKDIHAVETKREYLTELGFVVGKDCLSEKDLYTLKAIEDCYFRLEILPTLN